MEGSRPFEGLQRLSFSWSGQPLKLALWLALHRAHLAGETRDLVISIGI